MKRLPTAPRVLRTLTLVLAASGLAAGCVPARERLPADTTQAAERGGRMDPMQAAMPQMMRMHERMMADSVLHRRMMADPEMPAMMREMMGGETDPAAMRARMAAMLPDERQASMQRMHAAMTTRMEAMPPAERQAAMQRMMQMHQRMMADPAVRERMMADPEMRRMMDAMPDGMPGMDGMDHGSADHGSTGH